ncbi:asparagine synthase (glutamine-hydrolyzing) [Persicimonas caeni]|nr:asparagine synthase (glutamine-hydrolyzing) [Persicimonas caeni]
MIGALAHRGPDDRGVFSDEQVVLGHRRLSILDPSPLGHQPMAAADGRVQVVFNGEIYNFHELRDQLGGAGHTFRSDSDTEVLLYGFLEWGEALIERLVGDFAFAIYDGREQALLLARDRFGVKPLYYARLGDQLVFASEVRAILRSGRVAAQLDEARLPEFLSLQSVAPPATLVEGVRMLEPGATMRVDAGGVCIRKFWDLAEHAAEPLAGDPATMRREVQRRLYRAVERQMVSDVPLGAFLSGGIDSSAVVGMMSRLVERPIQTIAVAFDDAGFDDGHFARIAADAFGTDHVEVKLTDDELYEHAHAALGAQDHPSADGINTYIVSQAARRRGLKVALSGLGGDELFAGYSNFARLERLGRFQSGLAAVPAPLRHAVATVCDGPTRPIAAQKIAELLRSDGSIAEAYPVVRRVLSRAQLGELLHEPGDETLGVTRRLRQAFFARPNMPTLSQVSYAEATSYMHDILLRDTDQMSMAHSLEVRVPLLDHELAEYVVRIPDAVKRPKMAPKQLMVDALDGLLPDEIVHRPKQGFRMPFERWLKGPLRDTCRTNLQRVAAIPSFREHAIATLWEDFLAGKASVSWSRVWLLNCLGSWIANVLEPTSQ